MSNNWLIITLVAVAIIAILAFYAGKLLLQVKRQSIAKEKLLIEKNNMHKVHDLKALNSVIIIVRAMKEEQCDFSEGCWRICVLLESLKLSSELEQQFPAIYSLYEKIKHMPILEERKKLEKRARMKLDLERIKAEALLKEDIQKDSELLHRYVVERISVLG